MLPIEDAHKAWQITLDAAPDFASLKASVHSENAVSPCVDGLRSVCWKTFLLFRNTDLSTWRPLIADSRDAYASLRQHLLKFIHHPEQIDTGADPLDDDKNSPWSTLRQDEELRTEILQDVERCMPEEPFFREARVQAMLLDILFIFCKLNQDIGYRQGMHELLAPIFWVVDSDAIITQAETSPGDETALMNIILDVNFIENDAFTLFALLMQSAKSFYELGEPVSRADDLKDSVEARGTAPIVARSRAIHEDLLAAVDPELSIHLSKIEILPQIFLIRWIRLLFGREFAFHQLLVLWDRLFAEDAGLDLVDLVCVSMLLRIRWQLVAASYSEALTMLLKYPISQGDVGPQSFVSDATYLRAHLDSAGGNFIIHKYSGRALSPERGIPSSFSGEQGRLSPFRQHIRRNSPLAAPANFIKQQGGVEAMLQGVAKGVYERGERLGVNRAVRDAVEDIRKNVQGLTTPPSLRSGGARNTAQWPSNDGRIIKTSGKSVVDYERRNRLLGIMLNEAMNDLRKTSHEVASSSISVAEAIDLAIAKIQFVQVYLEDSNIPLPSATDQETTTDGPRLVKDAADDARTEQSSPGEDPQRPPATTSMTFSAPRKIKARVPRTEVVPATSEISSLKLRRTKDSIDSNPTESPVTLAPTEPTARPQAPAPTRSTIAQSSFAWMVEPSSSPPKEGFHSKDSSPFTRSTPSRRPISAASRNKAAFLFGEDDDAVEGARRMSRVDDSDDGFRLGTMRRK